MKLIIAGSRSTRHDLAIAQVKAAASAALTVWPEPTAILEGGARGIDAAAKAHLSNYYPVRSYPADWDKYGKGAGPVRNRQMAQDGDYLLAIWDYRSPGTGNMIETMASMHKPVLIVHPDAPGEICGSFFVTTEQMCKAKGWKAGTVLEKDGNLFKINRIENGLAYGGRCNSMEQEFSSEKELNLWWDYKDITGEI
jgi:hypothetical protein